MSPRRRLIISAAVPGIGPIKPLGRGAAMVGSLPPKAIAAVRMNVRIGPDQSSPLLAESGNSARGVSPEKPLLPNHP